MFNVGVDIPFASRVAEWMNERLPGGSGKAAYTAKTTTGEVVKLWGYFLGSCLLPDVPWDGLWRKKRQNTDLVDPPNFGKHGLSKNRADHLKSLHQQMFSAEEEELDPEDDWRYCRAAVASFNERRKLISPSWLMLMDEMMSLWLGQEGVVSGAHANPNPIPVASYVERKPDPLGCEIKVAADGVTGCFTRLEICEGATRHALQKWFDEYGHTTATCLRLLEPYFSKATPTKPDTLTPTRAVYVDRGLWA